MIVNNLSKISVNELIDCFLKAFEGYYVKMPSDKNYYKERWKAASVDLNFSYGMFDKGKLVGFIIHAIDKRFGKLIAFNTGTGVLPEYRRKGIVHSIYDYALRDLWMNGVKSSTLEVIRKNKKAIRCYEKVGFSISKKYKCYSGTIKIEKSDRINIKELALKSIDWSKLPYSGLMGIVASQYHQTSKAEDHRKWIALHIPVTLSSTNYFNGNDKALNVVMKLIKTTESRNKN